ncbi:branched-chain amino acid transport system substrate-binding protein [Parafrankia irregularis]|uniref:Branched-chain amino acid transport system substrate-binding protein n=1 Tax=Parafrankia irregularis TaxID=795642 RepID=A0A0S4QLX5_9ACTN|nr:MULTISPECIES: ABC transporter substrate-binding protein [Parafrankia]MBE3200269.1 ABC transporter substrate-binding protein [Parafrankia sp. CH37]CUU56531.1 branched-chain amino acid transport system substrate-binding protein [Parafrankia irregularis]
MKKVVPIAALALATSVALAACGSPGGSSADTDSSGGGTSPIKVALIPPSTGALAQYGTDEVRGWQLAVDEVNAAGGVDGHPVELIKKTTDGKSGTTLQAAREAVTKDGARFIGAVMTSTEAAALNAQLGSLGALAFHATAKDAGLVGKQCVANSFHIVQTDTMDINALASALKTMPGTKWAIQAVDYSTGHSAADTFTEAARAAGKQVVLQQFAPLNTTDFGSYITKIKSSGADALFAVEYGADGVAFVKQAAQFDLASQVKTVLGFNMVSEPLFPVLGDGVTGYYNNVGYDVHADNELNKKFVAAYAAKYGSAPYYVPADNYLAAKTLFAAVEKAGSTDPDEVGAALDGLTFDSIVGPVTMRGADHQLLRPSYLGQVAGSDTGLEFKILASAPASQTSPTPSPDCDL